jgi:DNA-binding SARP family transcriptional activator
MRFLVLGPLRIIGIDGHDVVVTRPTQRALLAVLLLHPNRPVPVPDLINLLVPTRALNGSGVIRTHIYALRKYQGLAARIQTTHYGYQMALAPESLDLLQFRQHVDMGRAALEHADYETATRSLSCALSLWRDPPLVDLPGTPAAKVLKSKIIEERHRAFHDLIDTKLTLGRHGEFIHDLLSHVEASPADERAWGLLMIALYRSGRRADALDAFLRARARLTESYGIEPSQDLSRIHQRILTDDLGDDLSFGGHALLRRLPESGVISARRSNPRT